MPNDDYIKRSDASESLNRYAKTVDKTDTLGGMLRLIVRDIPAADVEPVRHGRWIKSPECPEEYDICSVCGLNDKHRTRADQEHPAFESLPPRCKWCGAKMDAELPKGEDDDNKNL